MEYLLQLLIEKIENSENSGNRERMAGRVCQIKREICTMTGNI